MKKQFLCAIFVFFSLQASAAIEFPELTGRVIDNADMLSESDESFLERKLKKHEEQTTNQMVIVTIESLQGYSIEEFGYQLGRHWEIGQKGKDNGVLLIVAQSDRKVRIEVGYGLEGTLTDAIAGHIIRTKITSAFKKGFFASGIHNGVDAILSAIGGTYQIESKKPKNKQDQQLILWLFIGFIILIYHFVGLIGGRSSSNHRYYGGCSSGVSSSGGFGGGFSGGGGGFGGGGASGGW